MTFLDATRAVRAGASSGDGETGSPKTMRHDQRPEDTFDRNAIEWRLGRGRG
jgi:hypothetical protein